MQKHFFIAALFLLFSQPISSQNIAELYAKNKYAAITRIAEKEDTTTAFSPLELYQIGRSYFNTENTGKALTYFEKSLAAGRDSANVHFFMGLCYKEFKDLDKAMTAFDTAIKRDSTDQYFWAEKGLVYFSQEKITDAIKSFETAVQKPYQYEYPYFVLLSLYVLNRDAAKVAPFYEKWEKTIAKSEHYQLESWKLMGNFEKALNKNLPKALVYFEKALEKDLLNMNAYEEVMKVYTAQEKWKKVDKVFDRLKTAYDEKRLNQEDCKRQAAVVDAFPLNDSLNVLTVWYFKKPEKFADPIYKTYVIHVAKDSTMMVFLTEKSLSLFDEKADNHMLCGYKDHSHLNFGMITTNGKIKLEDYKKRVWAILQKRFEPVASSTSNSKGKD